MSTPPTHTEHDQRLLLATAQAGDERAFRRLVDPYRRALHVHCYRMLGSPHDAEDTVQETLLRAWRALDRFEPRATLKTWLYRIATNACLDELERRPRRPVPLVLPYPDAPAGGSGAVAAMRSAEPTYDPAGRYALREGMELALMTAIQELPGRQRAILILRDVLGWTAPEVAELLCSTVAAVNSALQRARATIESSVPAETLTRTRDARHGAERELLNRYVAAWEDDDIEGLVALLREDAVLRMPPQPSVHGAGAIGVFFRDTAAGGDLRQVRLTATSANGRPAVTAYRYAPDGTLVPHGVLVLELDADAAAVGAIDAFIDGSLPQWFGGAR
jgi:RNA polymerase sigma-70 factor (ECF subfamily)